MDAVKDFEDLLVLLERHEVRYLIIGGLDEVWQNRIQGRYGSAPASWVDLDGLIAIKKRIDHPRHQDDVRILERVRERRTR